MASNLFEEGYEQAVAHLAEFREEWAARPGFVRGEANEIRAWGGENSEGYRVLTDALNALGFEEGQ